MLLLMIKRHDDIYISVRRYIKRSNRKLSHDSFSQDSQGQTFCLHFLLLPRSSLPTYIFLTFEIYIFSIYIKRKKIYEIPSIEHRSLLTIFDAVIEIFRETRAEILTRNRNSLRIRILLCDSSHCTDCVRYR